MLPWEQLSLDLDCVINPGAADIALASSTYVKPSQILPKGWGDWEKIFP